MSDINRKRKIGAYFRYVLLMFSIINAESLAKTNGTNIISQCPKMAKIENNNPIRQIPLTDKKFNK